LPCGSAHRTAVAAACARCEGMPGQPAVAPRQIIALARAVHSEYRHVPDPVCAALAQRAERLARCVEAPPRNSASAFLWVDDVYRALGAALQVSDRVSKRAQPRSAVRAWLQSHAPAQLLGDGADRDLRLLRAASQTLAEWLSAFEAVHRAPQADLVADLEDERAASRAPAAGAGGVPPLCRRFFVATNAPQFDQAKTSLLRIAAGDSATGVVCVAAGAGMGKSTFVSALAHDRTVVDAFPDGVAWISLSPLLQDGCFLRAVEAVASVLAGNLVAAEMRVAAADPAALDRVFAEYGMDAARCLVVVDDVEGPVDAARLATVVSMLSAGDASRRAAVLFTTSRPPEELRGGLDTVVHTLLPMSPLGEDARAVFDSWAKITPLHRDYHSAGRSRVVQACGGLPLALAIAGAALRKSGYAWDTAVARLDASHSGGALVGCDGESAVPLLLGWLMGMWGDHFAAGVLALSALPPGVVVPESVLAKLWGSDGAATRVQLRRLERHGLATAEGDPSGTQGVRLHRGVTVLCAQLAESSAAYHRLLVEEYVTPASRLPETSDRCGRWLSAIAAGGSAYMDVWLAWHMVSGAMASELATLLCDFRWIARRLRSVGSRALLDDYATLLGSPGVLAEREGMANLASAVSEASGLGELCESALAMRLSGRLLAAASAGDAVARRVCASIDLHAKRPWFRHEQRRVTGAHSGFIAKLAVCASGAHPAAVSVGEDGCLKVWSLRRGEAGKLLHELGSPAHGHAVAAISEGFVYSGGGDGVVRVYSRQSGQCVSALTRHSSAVTAVAVSSAKDSGPEPFYVASGAADGSVTLLVLFGTKSGCTRQHTFPGGNFDEVTALCVLPCQRKVILGTFDGFASVWSWESGERAPLNGHKDHVLQFCAMTGGETVASSCNSGFAYVWSTSDGSLLWMREVGFSLSCFSLRRYCAHNFFADVAGARKTPRSPLDCPYFCAGGGAVERGNELVAVSLFGAPQIMGSGVFDARITAVEEVWTKRGPAAEASMVVLAGLESGHVLVMRLVTSLGTSSGPSTSTRRPAKVRRRAATTLR
jgi:hypothetical protein